MKKKIATLALILISNILVAPIFSSCDSDTNCYIDVLVLDETTRNPVSGVNVELYSQNCEASDHNYQTGKTGSDGIFSTHYIAPAILNIKCIYNLPEGGFRQGVGTARLIEGDTKLAEVTLESTVRY